MKIRILYNWLTAPACGAQFEVGKSYPAFEAPEGLVAVTDDGKQVCVDPYDQPTCVSQLGFVEE